MYSLCILLGSFVSRLLVLLHVAATLYMVGVIWMVQLAHYPLMARIGAGELPAWQADNLRRTTYVVGPPMLVEAATAVALVVMGGVGPWPWVGLGLLAAVWLSTAIWQVPAHDVLARGADAATISRLVRTNWVRTVAWTLRGVIALYMVEQLGRLG